MRTDVSFRELGFEIQYAGLGQQILASFVLPALQCAVSYDRVTSFFSTNSLLAIAQGIDGLRRRGGHMRLVLGLHDVPGELAEAASVQEDWADTAIRAVRERILQDISTLMDELSLDRLATLAWMLHDGLLEVRVAAPLSPQGMSGAAGIFHSKSYVLRDGSGDVVAAVGSPNETVMGLGDNFEELMVFMSWEPSSVYVDGQIAYFEKLWRDEQPGLRVRPLTSEFADEILAALPKRPKRPAPSPAPDVVGRLVELARRMPPLAFVSLESAALFPHQERVVIDALSRWPVRALLADEVGLGKTFEAGMVVAYARRFLDVGRVLVLAPKAVLGQWQEELKLNFGLDFWVYDSGAKAYLSFSGESRLVPSGAPALHGGAPELILMSAQYARGGGASGHAFDKAEMLPEMLVVDEAHAARVRADVTGRMRPTRMWRMLNDVALRVPHLLMLTATPMQIHWAEYHALLALLGLPGTWAKPDDYDRSLGLLVDEEEPSLEDANLLCELVRWSARMVAAPAGLTPAEQQLFNRICDPSTSSAAAALAAEHAWEDAVKLLARLHPAHLLTLRNARSALKQIGYTFPERNLVAPSLDAPEAVGQLNLAIDAYLGSAYFEVERAAHPDRRFNVGFVRCSYQQRLASSLHSCRLSLERRRDRVSSILAGIAGLSLDSGLEEASDVEVDDDLAELQELLSGGSLNGNLEQVQWAAQLELSYMCDVLSCLDAVESETVDPKMQEMVRLIEQHVPQDRVLVFSRYTDTVAAAVEAFRSVEERIDFSGIALFTGQDSWIDRGQGPQPASRRAVREALDSGAVGIVFCSDAASEGLNLQAARVIINVDVPWNPARLEQRIGRIARLGQRAATVDIYNLWYPDSVEARIYTRLLKRKDLYDLAVGEFPELISEAIQEELAAKLGTNLQRVPSDPIDELQAVRTQEQLRAIERVWRTGSDAQPISGLFREELLSLVARCVERRGGSCQRTVDEYRLSFDGQVVIATAEPGRRESFCLGHAACDQLRLAAGRSPDFPGNLGVVSWQDTPLAFAFRSEDQLDIVCPEGVPALLEAVVLGESLEVERWTKSVSWDGESVNFAAVAAVLTWLPDHAAMSILLPEAPPLPGPWREEGAGLTFRTLAAQSASQPG